MTRLLLTAAAIALLAVPVSAGDVELAGLKAKTPEGWKEETPSNSMRMAQFKLPKAEGSEDAELALFVFPGGSGSVEANLKRQEAKFESDGRKAKTEKIKVGTIEATYQNVTGTFIKKAFPMAQTGTPVPNYQQLYVVFEAKDGKQYYMTLLGPAKTVEKHEKDFKNWLTSFK